MRKNYASAAEKTYFWTLAGLFTKFYYICSIVVVFLFCFNILQTSRD